MERQLQKPSQRHLGSVIRKLLGFLAEVRELHLLWDSSQCKHHQRKRNQKNSHIIGIRMGIIEKFKAFLNIKPPKTDLAEEIRKEAFEKERIRLAVIEGKKEAGLLSKKRLEEFKQKQKESKPKQKSKQKEINDGISPTFSLYK